MSKSKIELKTLQEIKEIVSNSETIQQVLSKIGYSQTRDMRIINAVKSYCESNQIDYSHLVNTKYIREKYPDKLVCNVCNIEKPYTDYYISNNRMSHTCKQCTQKNEKQKYKNKQDKLNRYKETLKCKKCGEDRFYLLDFHHIDPTQKDFSISDNSRMKLESLMKEIEKCEVLCSNCHREFHYLNKEKNITLQEYLEGYSS